MRDDYERLIQEVVQAGIGGGDSSTEDFLEGAVSARKAAMDKWLEVSRALNMLDAFVAYHVPDAIWDQAQQQWVTRQAGSLGSMTAAQRKQRILELANELANQGASTVATKAIAERLSLEGDTPSPSSLATAAGNVLSRSPGWRRVGEGTYEPVPA